MGDLGRALDLFLELAAVPSPSGEERAVADRVLGYLHDLGLEPTEDDTGASIGSTMGNIHVALEPTRDGEPLFLCAHLDTVPPVDAIEPVVEDGIVRNRRPPSSAATTRRPWSPCSRRPPRAGRKPPPRRDRAPLHLREEAGLLGRTRSTTRACGHASATSTTRRHRSVT